MKTYLLKESSGEVVTEIVCGDRERAIELAREHKLINEGDGRYLKEWPAAPSWRFAKEETVKAA